MVYQLWTELPYAGEKRPPKDAVDPFSGEWRTYFIKHNKEGFETLNGRDFNLAIRNPNTVDWDKQLNMVQHVLANITNKQIRIATYWGTGDPTKQWAPIADRLIDTYDVSAPRAGRILAALYAGINDTFVVTWYEKFKWQVARPNQLDQNLATILCTPRHPSYPSGHAAVAGVAETILSYFFPAERRKLHKLAEECARSRLYAGVHFPVDNEQGLRLGRQIGEIVVNELQNDRDKKGIVDVPYRNYRNAKLIPPPYEQAIPYDFEDNCSSLVKNQNHVERTKIPKPTFFL